jgi:hypothetical protein
MLSFSIGCQCSLIRELGAAKKEQDLHGLPDYRL